MFKFLENKVKFFMFDQIWFVKWRGSLDDFNLITNVLERSMIMVNYQPSCKSPPMSLSTDFHNEVMLTYDKWLIWELKK